MTIAGVVKSTPTPWLPVLSNIAPPKLRRAQAVDRQLGRIRDNQNLPLYEDIFDPPHRRLKSRHPIWTTTEEDFVLNDKWREDWNDTELHNKQLIGDPTQRVRGFDLPRRAWVQLNRTRTEHGCCNYLLWKWGKRTSPGCDCGAELQTAQHIVEECPTRSFPGGLEASVMSDQKQRNG